jgi:hypothetical protein
MEEIGGKRRSATVEVGGVWTRGLAGTATAALVLEVAVAAVAAVAEETEGAGRGRGGGVARADGGRGRRPIRSESLRLPGVRGPADGRSLSRFAERNLLASPTAPPVERSSRFSRPRGSIPSPIFAPPAAVRHPTAEPSSSGTERDATLAPPPPPPSPSAPWRRCHRRCHRRGTLSVRGTTGGARVPAAGT